MIYTADNARGANVHDMDSGRKINYVVSIDIDRACVVVYPQPYRIAENGDTFVTEAIYFARIEVCRQEGDNAHLLRFDCYGRQA